MKKYLYVVVLFVLALILFIPEKEKALNQESFDYITIDIKGSINNPGVYKIISGSRVIDAIKLSGGLREDASTKYINLSRKLNDEDTIIIYSQSEVDNTNEDTMIKIMDNTCNCPSIKNDACLTDAITNDKALVNINTASLSELMTIKGFGTTKAQAVIDYRTTNGNFTTIEDITKVKGIGESTFNKIKAYLTI